MESAGRRRRRSACRLPAACHLGSSAFNATSSELPDMQTAANATHRITQFHQKPLLPGRPGPDADSTAAGGNAAGAGFRRSIRSRVTGRWRTPGRPEKGRFTRADVDWIVQSAWQELDSLLPAARLERYPRQGTRLNAFLSVATLASYRAVRRAGIDKGHAIGLVADAGWPVYHDMIRIARFPARLLRRTPQGRIDFVIRAFLRFPFAPPADSSAAGYRVEAWKDEAGMHTHWTRCPPLDVFHELCEADELDAFRGTWCAFDYPAAEAIAAGGRFIRPHVLSRGDPVCDMTWTTVDNEVVQEVGRGGE